MTQITSFCRCGPSNRGEMNVKPLSGFKQRPSVRTFTHNKTKAKRRGCTLTYVLNLFDYRRRGDNKVMRAASAALTCFVILSRSVHAGVIESKCIYKLPSSYVSILESWAIPSDRQTWLVRIPALATDPIKGPLAHNRSNTPSERGVSPLFRAPNKYYEMLLYCFLFPSCFPSDSNSMSLSLLISLSSISVRTLSPAS